MENININKEDEERIKQIYKKEWQGDNCLHCYSVMKDLWDKDIMNCKGCRTYQFEQNIISYEAIPRRYFLNEY